MAIPDQRREHPGGFSVERFARLPGGRMVHGSDVYEYITADSLYVVGSSHTLRSTWLNSEPVLDPARAQELWREAGWIS